MTALTDDEMKLAMDTFLHAPGGLRGGVIAAVSAVLAWRAPTLDPDRLTNAVRAGCAAPGGCGYPECVGGVWCGGSCARPAIIERALAADDVWQKAHGAPVDVDADHARDVAILVDAAAQVTSWCSTRCGARNDLIAALEMALMPFPPDRFPRTPLDVKPAQAQPTGPLHLATLLADARVRGLVKAATSARGQFAVYAEHHRNAGAYEKAATNQDFDALLDHALTPFVAQSNPETGQADHPVTTPSPAGARLGAGDTQERTVPVNIDQCLEKREPDEPMFIVAGGGGSGLGYPHRAVRSRDMSTPTDADFRAAGFTGAAREFPLSAVAQQWIANFNGVEVGAMPDAWRFAPNAWMRDWLEREAERWAMAP